MKLLVDQITLAPVIASPLSGEAEGSSAMNGPIEANEPIETMATASPARRRCLAPGCPCADGRILLHRHAAFFAALAAKNGQTADRVISPEPEWTMAWGKPS
jgi:hypothetical protein